LKIFPTTAGFFLSSIFRNFFRKKFLAFMYFSGKFSGKNSGLPVEGFPGPIPPYPPTMIDGEPTPGPFLDSADPDSCPDPSRVTDPVNASDP
jgi:hypothetical protein